MCFEPLELKPGQMLVMSVPDECLSDNSLSSFSEEFRSHLISLGVSLLVIPNSIKLSVIDVKDIPRRNNPHEPIIKLID